MDELPIAELWRMSAHADALTQVRHGLQLVFFVGWIVGMLVGLALRFSGRGRFRLMPPWWSVLALCISALIAREAIPIAKLLWFALATAVLWRTWKVGLDPFGEYRSSARETVGAGASLGSRNVSLLRRVMTSDLSRCEGVGLRAGLAIACLMVASFVALNDAREAAFVGGDYSPVVIAVALMGLICALWAVVAAYNCVSAADRKALTKRAVPRAMAADSSETTGPQVESSADPSKQEELPLRAREQRALFMYAAEQRKLQQRNAPRRAGCTSAKVMGILAIACFAFARMVYGTARNSPTELGFGGLIFLIAIVFAGLIGISLGVAAAKAAFKCWSSRAR